MRRTVVFNASVDSDLHAILLSLGPGRYRVELRDSKRQVVHVRAYEVRGDGSVTRALPLRRKKPRKVPPPRFVAKGTHPAYVQFAPPAREPPPAHLNPVTAPSHRTRPRG